MVVWVVNMVFLDRDCVDRHVRLEGLVAEDGVHHRETDGVL
jgi:hypothetical protein